MQNHWREWTCMFGCDETFSKREEFEDHLSSLHPNVTDKDQVDMCERRVDPMVQKTCPLCDEVLGSLKLFHKHVGKHLVEVALFALRDDNEDESGGENEGEEDDSQSQDEVSDGPIRYQDSQIHQSRQHWDPIPGADERWQEAKRALQEAVKRQLEAERARDEEVQLWQEAERAQKEEVKRRQEAVRAWEEEDQRRQEAERAQEEEFQRRQEAERAQEEEFQRRQEAERVQKEKIERPAPAAPPAPISYAPPSQQQR